MTPPRRPTLLLAIVVAGVALRVAWVARPFDHRLLAPWREADYVQLARNFHRDGLDIRYPRIDWRGDGPGYAEMELPVLPWTAAVFTRSVFYVDTVQRWLAAGLSIASLFVFTALARGALPGAAGAVAVAAFAVNPLLVYLASAMQPEPLMLLVSLLAVAALWRWDDRPTTGRLLVAAALAGAALLAKASAAYLGLVFAWTVMRRRGARALVDPGVLLAAALAVGPPLAWYAWAAHFWTTYGNSLGVSNESHLLGLDMLWPPRFLVGLLQWETLGVVTPAGWLLLAAAALRPRTRVAERALLWYAAAWIFYLATARTSADGWAFYYHSSSVAPACLLLGAGCAAVAAGTGVPRALAGRAAAVAGVLAAATLAALVAATAFLVHQRDARDDYRAMYACAHTFTANVPPDGRIVAHGGSLVDEYDAPVAHNESMLFAWMDRTGFNYATQELSVAMLDGLAARGGRYWIVTSGELQSAGLEDVVDERYRKLAECGTAYRLYDLRPRT
jgi:hypothetical protein